MNDINAERAVLGSILIDNVIIKEVGLDIEDFYFSQHQQIYKAMLSLEVIDLVTLNAATKGQFTVELTELTEHPTAANAKHYARIVKEHSLKRQADAIVKRAVNNLLDEDVHTTIATTINDLRALDQYSEDYFRVNKLTHSVVDEMIQEKVETRGMRTHIHTLDRAIGCLRNSDLIIIGARPSMGKTAMALSILLNAAINGDASLIFSLEMSKEQITERLLCQLSGISMQDINLKLDMENNIEKTVKAGEGLYGLPIFINDRANTYRKIEQVARHAYQEENIKAIFIDYLTLMKTNKSMGDNRNQQIGYVTRSLKALAKELNIPIILLAQLNRSLEQRTNKRPILSDLRDSGEIEQDADIVMFLYRDERYNRDSEDKGLVEIDTPKARNLSPAWFKLKFLSESMRFADQYEEE
jgi:replicative DNA helicase